MVVQIRDVVADVPYRFRPVVHLRTGGVMALEVQTPGHAGFLDHVQPVSGIAERSRQLDVGFAAEAARRATEHGIVLPLHLSLWADTVSTGHDPLPVLVDTLGDLGLDADQIVIRLVVPPGQAPPDHLDTGLARLRAAGFGLGLDAAGAYPMITVLEAGPEVLLASARHTIGPSATPTARAALAGSVALARHTGATLIVDGCDTPEQAAVLRAHGIYHVQGQLLGPSRRYPHTQPVPAVVLDRRTTPAWPAVQDGPYSLPRAELAADTSARGPAIAADLAHPAAMMPSATTTGEAARAVFAARPELTGVVLVDDHQHPLLSLHRDRFMLAITGPFGHALHARRLAAGLGDLPRMLDLQTRLTDVVDLVADTPAQHMYDDIVVTDDYGRCQGVLRIGDLVRDLAKRQTRPPPTPPALHQN